MLLDEEELSALLDADALAEGREAAVSAVAAALRRRGSRYHDVAPGKALRQALVRGSPEGCWADGRGCADSRMAAKVPGRGRGSGGGWACKDARIAWGRFEWAGRRMGLHEIRRPARRTRTA